MSKYVILNGWACRPFSEASIPEDAVLDPLPYRLGRLALFSLL